MRNRLFEISAVIAGIAVVAAVYLYRTDSADTDSAVVSDPALPGRIEPERIPPANEAPLPAKARTSLAVPDPEPAPAEAVDEAELETVRSAWESAVADIEAVEAELNVLDERFDAKEAELAEMESQGMDPELLEEEMLIFLDGIVDEYDELETRLAEAEAVETAAAERLARLTGA